MGIKAVRKYFNIPDGYIVQVQHPTENDVRNMKPWSTLVVGFGLVSERWFFLLRDPSDDHLNPREEFFKSKNSSGGTPEFILKMSSDRLELLSLWREEDTSDAWQTVYTSGFPESLVKAVECEQIGYPHVTRDGELMYENSHFASRDASFLREHNRMLQMNEQCVVGLLSAKEKLFNAKRKLDQIYPLFEKEGSFSMLIARPRDAEGKSLWITEDDVIALWLKLTIAQRMVNPYEDLHLLLTHNRLFYRYDDNGRILYLSTQFKNDVANVAVSDFCSGIDMGTNVDKDDASATRFDHYYYRLQNFTEALFMDQTGVRKRLVEAVANASSGDGTLELAKFTARLRPLKKHLKPFVFGQEVNEPIIIFPTIIGDEGGPYYFSSYSMVSLQAEQDREDE